MRTRILAGAAALGLSAAALAATAGAVSATTSRSADTELSLVAYSTPREAYAKLIPSVPEDGGRRRRRLQAVVRLLRRPDARGQGRSGRRHRRAIARSRRRRARRRRERRRDLEEAVVQRDGHELARRLRRPRRQPEEDQELERPAPPGRRRHDAEPVHVGRRPLERHGGLRGLAEGRQDRQAGAGEPAQALPERRRPGQERPRRRSTRSSAERATCCSPTRTRRSSLGTPGAEPPVRHPEVDDPDREPDRRPEDSENKDSGERVPPLPARRRPRSRCSPTTATGRSSRASSRRTGRSSRCGPASSRSTSSASAAGTKVQKSFFDPKRASWRGSSGRSAASLASVAAAAARPAALRRFEGQGRQRPCPSALSRPSSRSWSCCRSPRSSGSRRRTGRRASGTPSRAPRPSRR